MGRIREWWKRHVIETLGKAKPEEIDTSPAQFEKWISRQIGKGLLGGDEFYAVAIRGQREIPKINGKFMVYVNYQEAAEKLRECQYEESVTLVLKHIRVYYSIT